MCSVGMVVFPGANAAPDASHKFLEAKWLGYVVVRAALQARYGVCGGTPGGEDDNWNVQTAFAQHGQHGKPIKAGEPDVQQQ